MNAFCQFFIVILNIIATLAAKVEEVIENDQKDKEAEGNNRNDQTYVNTLGRVNNADIVCFCHDCGNDICRLPQMFSMSFAKPVIGIVTKADSEDVSTEQAELFLHFLPFSFLSINLCQSPEFSHQQFSAQAQSADAQPRTRTP